MDSVKMREAVEAGKTILGIEFGSTRIKAVLTNEENTPIAQGAHDWENRLENGIWTYTLEDIWSGLQDAYAKLAADVKSQCGASLKKIGAIGFSAMMHGYMVFDKEGTLMVPFRTWRNTITEQAAKQLTAAFSFNIPQRWSIAHLYQAMLNKEEHVKDIAFFTTLAGFIHWKLTGERYSAWGMHPECSQSTVIQKIMMQQCSISSMRWQNHTALTGHSVTFFQKFLLPEKMPER